MSNQCRYILALSIAAVAVVVQPAAAQSWPNRPLALVVSYPAGGDTDAVARLFAEKLSAPAGQPVLIGNCVGASGTIGNADLSKAALDGCTLLLTPGTSASAPVVLKSGSGAAYDATMASRRSLAVLTLDL